MNVGMSNSMMTAIRDTVRDMAIGKTKHTEKADRATVEKEQIQKYLEGLSQEEKDDPTIRDKTFEELIGRDKHGRTLCMGVGIRPTSIRSQSSQFYEVEIAQLPQVSEEQKILHQQELKQVRVEMRQDAEERDACIRRDMINMMQMAGITISNDNLPTPTDDS